MTRSTGTSGLIFLGSPPARFMAERMAARSTTAGTPVKSWRRTRAGLKGISALEVDGGVPGGELADVGFGDLEAVEVAEAALQEDLDGVGETGNAREPGLFETRQAEVLQVSGFGGERCLWVQESCHSKSAFRGGSNGDAPGNWRIIVGLEKPLKGSRGGGRLDAIADTDFT